MKCKRLFSIPFIACLIFGFAVSPTSAAGKLNILVIWGDDSGVHNISAYNHGIMGYQTPNIDRIANEGAMFTHAYAQQSCTAGRAAFMMGQHPFRTGMLTIGMPGSEHGIPDWTPTTADIMKKKGYATAQFGKTTLAIGTSTCRRFTASTNSSEIYIT
jgi:arylsulfatase